MKKVVSVVLVFVLAFSLAALSGCGSSDQVTLNVYNWGINIADGPEGGVDYIDVVEKFIPSTGHEMTVVELTGED